MARAPATLARDGSRFVARRLLVLGAGAAQLDLLRAARSCGLSVIAADRDPGAPGFVHADRRAIVSAEDEVAIESLARAESVDGIIAPGIDWPVAIAARVAERLGLPHPIDAATATLATAKVPQRQALAAAGVPQPRWEVVGSESAALALGFGVPCVVKAPDRQGQRGLTLVREPSELAAAVRGALAASRSGGCIVEELAPGPEVTVNAFSSGGRFHALTITDRLTADPPAFGVALAHAWPSSLRAEQLAAASDAAARAATALGIAEGPTYTQLRVGPDGPRVVEVAARLGGGHDAALCGAVLGVDLNGLALDAALGEDPGDSLAGVSPEHGGNSRFRGNPLPKSAPRTGGSAVGGGCVRFLVPPEGELRGVDGLDRAASAPGVLAVHLYRRAGHRFGPFRIGADRAGAILAVGSDREDALERAAFAADLLRFDVVDAEAPAHT